MLTGKDIHAAFQQYDRHAAASMEDAGAYGVVADILNAQFITPMQDQMKRLESNERATFNDAISIIGDTLTDAMTVASDLQGRITALKGVVKELVALLEDDELMIEESPDGWYDRKRKAYDTAQQLLGEDIP